MSNKLENFLACTDKNDIRGRMGAAGFAGALIGTYVGFGVATPVTATVSGIAGMALGALPTAAICAYEVATAPEVGAPPAQKLSVPNDKGRIR